MRALHVTLAAGALVLAAVPAPAVAKPAPIYRSPGYRGLRKLPKVTLAPIAPITLGTGKLPSVLVDAAGTGHLLFSTDGGGSVADTVSYCRLARGQKTCAATSSLAPEAPAGGESGPFAGNFPGGNADTHGPIPIVQGNALYLVDHRFPDVFTQPDGKTGERNVFLWASQDGGQTFSGPAIIGDNQMGGGAIAYGGADHPSIGTISRTQTGGTTFQGVGAGQFTRAKALLGPGDQAYDGGLAVDGDRPIAAFADLAPTIYVREWSGSGDVNDPATWSSATFPGSEPRIAGGPAGVFVLYRDKLVGGNVLVRRIAGGAPSGTPVKLSGPAQNATIAQDDGGRLVAGWVDDAGVELRTSSDGASWTPAQLIAPKPAGGTIGDLALAATADGGGFAEFIQNPAGGQGVGTVAASVFGTQQATGRPGLGQLPGGGVGSQLGDQFATTTCSTATFGVVTARVGAGCFAHDKNDPNLDVSLGEVNINGVSIIPDAGVKIAINPRQHTIDTTGSVSVVLKGPGIDVTLWHGELHVKLPVATPGVDLFDFPELKPPDVAGFPIDGHVNVKLVKGGVQVPVSLKLPGAFGGITGSATLSATLDRGLDLDSLEFQVASASFGALELKDVDISYTRDGEVWKGSGTANVPTGGKLFSLSLAIEFDHGDFKSGSFEVGLPYPGVPMDLNDTPPQLYLARGGLGLGLGPPSLSGTVRFGVTPLYTEAGGTPGADGSRDYAFTLDGGLTAAFGDPVKLTVTADGYLYSVRIADARLVYTLPDTVALTGTSNYDLGLVEQRGTLQALIDPHAHVFGGRIAGSIVLHVGKLGLSSLLPSAILDGGDITLPSQAFAINTKGFGIYIPPTPGIPFIGTITYDWGDDAPVPHPFTDVTSDYANGLPSAASARVHGRAAGAEGFDVPAGAPAVALDVTGDGGAPDVVLTAPDGSKVVPVPPASGAKAVAIGDPRVKTTYVGIDHPAAGRWTVAQTPGSAIAISGLRYVVGEAAPTVSARVGGRGTARTLRYRVRAPKNVTVAFAEQTGSLFHVLGTARGAAGTLRFTPATGPAGKRSIVALIDNGGLPRGRPVVARYVAPGPVRPGRAARLRVAAGAKAFTVTFAPPRGATHTVVRVAATDGRRLQRVLPVRTRRLAIPVIGYRDGVTVTVAGVSAAGRRGPAVSARARRGR